MDRLIYSSLAAMRGAMQRQSTIASNMANLNTVGFRGEMTQAQSLWIKGQPGQGVDSRATVRTEVSGADMTGGEVNQTGRDLDIALSGDSMLAIQASNGDETYTRRGDLQIDKTGVMTTGDGALVMGDSGPITVPPYDKITIAHDGSISIIPRGGDPKEPQQVDRLKLVTPKGSDIRKGTDGLFRNTAGGTLPADPDAQVQVQALEGSNVSASQVLIEMVDASRAWDGQVKMLTTAQDLDKSSTELMRIDS
jgi:flagellar basal-body rod protein FlgF